MRLLAFLLLTTTCLFAQTPDGEEIDAETLLKRLDDSIYYPGREGLKDFRFRWKTAGDGVFEGLNDDLYIAYAWKTPGHVRLEYVNAEGNRIEKLPEIAKHPELVNVFKQLEGMGHALAQQLIVGAPYAEVYADYFKRLERRVINNKVEYDIVLTPKQKKRWTQIVIRVIEGLPRQVTKTDDQGRSLRLFLRFEPRGKKHIASGLRVEQNNQLVMDEVYSYTRIDGVSVLSQLVRATSIPEPSKETIRLERLQANIGLEDSYFTAAEKQSGDGDSKGAKEKKD